MSKIIDTFIRDLDQSSIILNLLKEIELVTRFPLVPHMNSPVIHYLTDYRERRPISTESIDAIPFSGDMLLTKKIKKLHETEIYWLCNEIAQIKHMGVEKVSGKTLYIFLDQYLQDKKKKKKKIYYPFGIY